ncbi:type IV secretion system protein [Paraburkholderia agricolaris]|jgi:type IV secretion system protein VirB6|uniref:Type IV secretion system protein n=1 Tax=Paraburkholderia agricolaris TaxID=2152888 RepID=A0ABW8ZLB6_9BURK
MNSGDGIVGIMGGVGNGLPFAPVAQANVSDFLYFRLVDNYLTDQINQFGLTLMGNFEQWVTGLTLTLVTIWILIEGYRIATGQSRANLMEFVVRSARVCLIVAAATSMTIFSTGIYGFLTQNLPTEINTLFTGSSTSVAETIDSNLAWTQLAMATIDTVQTAPDDQQSIGEKSRAQLLATFGTSSPPMAAGAMLLMYQFALALFIGMGPLFIMCLIFERTKSLFERWLLYGIGTIFSMALLSFVSSLVLNLTLRVAGAYWTATTINALTGQGAEGFTSQAMQQGGIGLLLTVLIVSVPPMAAYFFNGTLGSFMAYSAFGGSGARSAAMRSQGVGPGTAYGGGGYAPPQVAGQQGMRNGGGGDALGGGSPSIDPRMTGTYAAGGQPGSAPTPAPGTYGLAGKSSA